jgi:hypothetical protein
MTRARAEGELGLQLGGINGEEAPAHRGGRAGDGRWFLAAGEQGKGFSCWCPWEEGMELWAPAMEVAGGTMGGWGRCCSLAGRER